MVRNIKSSKESIVVIGSSTGGPKSLEKILTRIPKDFSASILIAQHMPEGFTKSMAERLDGLCNIKVKEAEDFEVVEDSIAYISKGSTNLKFVPGSENKLCYVKHIDAKYTPSIDYLLKSLIDSNYKKIIVVILTGMGSDGTIAIKELKKHKNIYVINQDEKSSVVYGMPKSVRDNNLSDIELSIEDIAQEIINKI